MNRRLIAAATTAFALFFLAAGVVLVFAPQETAGALFAADAGPPIVFSLLGAALFGIGEVNWIARRSLLGGIYGRAVVVGNAAHLLIGSLALIRLVAAGEARPALAAVTAVYVAGAALYGFLMFSSPRPERELEPDRQGK